MQMENNTDGRLYYASRKIIRRNRPASIWKIAKPSTTIRNNPTEK